MMFRRVLLTIALLGAMALGGIWAMGRADSVAAQTTEPAAAYDPTQTITVVGNGSVMVAPDVARVSAGVETSADTVSAAMQENRERMDAMMAALKALEIPDKDIQTANFSIYVDRYSEPIPTGEVGTFIQPNPLYRVSNMVNVIIRDLDKVSGVLDSVIEAGANNIWGVNFEVDDETAAQAEARSKAMANALSQGQALAELAEVQLGPVMAISEVIGGTTYPRLAAYAVGMGGGGDSSISPGELEVTYQVQVTYYIVR
jgi:uncharacterized protein YggE